MEKGEYEGLKVDLFAAGVILFVMLAGGPPFLSTKNSDKVYRFIRTGNYEKFWEMHERKRPFGFFNPLFKELLSSFLSADISLRPTLETLQTN
jgi:serine/threonine protein kinase